MPRVFCYKCKECGNTYQLETIKNTWECECGCWLSRDYKAEAVGIDTTNLKAAH